jgi:nicotinamidase-related amidase
MRDLDRTALIVVDVQLAFDELEHWSPNGRRDNPECEANVAALVDAWRAHGRPLVFVRHDSVTPGSPLRPGTPGNALRPELGADPDLLVTKQVNSAFHGDPDLDAWLRERDLSSIAVCGVQTNHCAETTARVGGNLGHDVLFVRDACHTFDRLSPDGELVTAEELTRATVTSLHGEFATVVRTADLLEPGPADGPR